MDRLQQLLHMWFVSFTEEHGRQKEQEAKKYPDMQIRFHLQDACMKRTTGDQISASG